MGGQRCHIIALAFSRFIGISLPAEILTRCSAFVEPLFEVIHPTHLFIRLRASAILLIKTNRVNGDKRKNFSCLYFVSTAPFFNGVDFILA